MVGEESALARMWRTAVSRTLLTMNKPPDTLRLLIVDDNAATREATIALADASFGRHHRHPTHQAAPAGYPDHRTDDVRPASGGRNRRRGGSVPVKRPPPGAITGSGFYKYVTALFKARKTWDG